MALIKTIKQVSSGAKGQGSIIKASQERNSKDSDPVPFVPAFDLLEKEEQKIKEQELAALAAAFYEIFCDTNQATEINWSIASRLVSVSQRKFK